MQGAVGYPTFLGMCDRARETDHDLTILLRSEPDWVRPGSEAQFLDRRCDGFIFVGDNRPEISEALVHHQIPVVECYSVAPPPGVTRVLGDNAAGTRQAVEHLVSLGHTRIAHIAGPFGNREADERLSGFRVGMQAAFGPNAANNVVRGHTWVDLWGFRDGQDEVGAKTRPLAEAVLAMGVTAVVCANDLFALALWRLAEERGMQIPGNLSITGMDDIAEAVQRGLTSVALPFERIGRAAVDAILLLQEGGDSRDASCVLPTELVKRTSAAPPPAK